MSDNLEIARMSSQVVSPNDIYEARYGSYKPLIVTKTAGGASPATVNPMRVQSVGGKP